MQECHRGRQFVLGELPSLTCQSGPGQWVLRTSSSPSSPEKLSVSTSTQLCCSHPLLKPILCRKHFHLSSLASPLWAELGVGCQAAALHNRVERSVQMVSASLIAPVSSLVCCKLGHSVTMCWEGWWRREGKDEGRGLYLHWQLKFSAQITYPLWDWFFSLIKINKVDTMIFKGCMILPS